MLHLLTIFDARGHHSTHTYVHLQLDLHTLFNTPLHMLVTIPLTSSEGTPPHTTTWPIPTTIQFMSSLNILDLYNLINDPI